MYRYRAEVEAASGESAVVMLPPDLGAVAVTVLPAGLATVQHTMDSRQLVSADPDEATWVSWEPGEVDEPVSRTLNGPVTAIRVTAVGGPATLQVLGGR